LGPAADWTALAADKQTACRLLAAAGVPVVEGISLPPGASLPLDFPYPAVLKRRDGAGSCDARRIDSPQSAERHPPLEFAARLEPLWPGRPASVALLLGAAGMFPLAPCWQKLADDGSFAYLGGEVIAETPLAHRAARLAERAVAALGPAGGYVGVDLLLGADASEDVIVEINPRLTTSYVGLRAAYDQNLAQAWLSAIEGNRPDIEAARVVAFRSDGVILQPQTATP
ncbi:MAG: ATP-grasp domain-containing protein, partial [Pirellulales bacterium]